MAWSTREIAELAGTSLRAVRHYHEIGLLAEPERRSNGYKQYGVAHLVRLVRIKRLVDLGFSLSQIADMGTADDHPEDALRTLDAELAATIERLQRARMELGVILRKSAPTDLPPELAPAADHLLSGKDRSFVSVMGTVLGPKGLAVYADYVQNPSADPVVAEFEKLPADADEQTCADVAERMVPIVRSAYRRHPGLDRLHEDAPRGKTFLQRTIHKAAADLYNPAQLEVIRRLGRLLADPEQAEDG